MLGGSMSSSRSRLGFSRGKDTTGIERAVLGFSRAATRGSLGVVKKLHANAAHPRLNTSGGGGPPNEMAASSGGGGGQRRDPVVTRSQSRGNKTGGGGCTGSSCTIPIRDRTVRQESIAEHHRQEDAMFPKPGALGSGGGGRNHGEAQSGGMYTRKGSKLPDYLRRDYSKYGGGNTQDRDHHEDDRQDKTYARGSGGASARDRFGARAGMEQRVEQQRVEQPRDSHSSRGYAAPEPEPEVYTFGPPTVAVKRSSSLESHQAPKQVRFDDEVRASEITERRPAVTFDSPPRHDDHDDHDDHDRQVDEDLATLDRLGGQKDTPQSNTDMETKFDSLLGMLDERFGALTSRSEQLEKIVTQLAQSQLAMADSQTQPRVKPEPKTKDEFYGKVGCKSLPFFTEMPPASLDEAAYEDECDCLASQGDWIMLSDPQVHPDTQASWYPARHIDPASGKRFTFWAPAALGDKPCFERFAAYPTA